MKSKQDISKVKLITHAATVRIKSNFSKLHLRSAKRFYEYCDLIEKEDSNKKWTDCRLEELKSYSSSAIIMSVAFLEASINELYLEAKDKNRDTLKPLSNEQMSLLSELWEEVHSFNALRKYQIALTACSKSPFDKGLETFQSASSLFTLRNRVVHFKPEWDDELNEHQKLESSLKGKFSNSRLTDKFEGRMVWFPNKCLGAGCARWAYNTAYQFSQEFTDKLGIRERNNI